MAHGRHLILDLYDCDKQLLDDYQGLESILEEALVIAKATILRMFGHKFAPQGVTILALLAESHCSIHTWPELGYAAVDLYTCGDTTKAENAADYIRDKLKAEHIEKIELVRSTTCKSCV